MPGVVVWVYYEGNDLVDLNVEAGARWLRAYLKPEHRQLLAERCAVVDSLYARWLDSLIAAGPPRVAQVSRMGALMHDVPRLTMLRGQLRFGVLFPQKESAIGLLPDILARANADVAAWGGKLVVAYVPAYRRYQLWGGDGHRGRAELIRTLRSQRIPLVDLTPVVGAEKDPRALWAHTRGHFNAKGYRLAGKAIARAIDSLRAVPSRAPAP
jgi:hypothetical protein